MKHDIYKNNHLRDIYVSYRINPAIMNIRKGLHSSLLDFFFYKNNLIMSPHFTYCDCIAIKYTMGMEIICSYPAVLKGTSSGCVG